MGNTALHILAEVSDQTETDGYGILKVLLEDNSDFITARVREACLARIDAPNIPVEAGEGSTALMRAVMHGHLECVKVLLQYGSSPHLIGPLYQPPLFHAVARDSIEVARVLLEYGAVVTREIEEQSRSLEMTILLIEHQDPQMGNYSSESSED